MANLSYELGALGVVFVKKLVWEVAGALEAAATASGWLGEHNICLTFWDAWVPGQHGQVSNGPISGGLYKCYG